MLVLSDSTNHANGAEQQVPEPSNADLRAAIEDLRLKLAGQDIKLASQDAIIRDLSVKLGVENDKSTTKTEHHEVPLPSCFDAKSKIKKLSHKIDHQTWLLKNTDEQLQEQAIALEEVENMICKQKGLIEAVDSKVLDQGGELRGLRESFHNRFDRLEAILQGLNEKISSAATSNDIDSKVVKTAVDKIDDQAAMIDRLEDTLETLSTKVEMDREDSKKELDGVLLELSQLRKAQQALAAETAARSVSPSAPAITAAHQSAESLAASHKAVLAQLPDFQGSLDDHTHDWLVKIIKVLYTSSTHQKLWVPLASMKLKGVAKVWWTLNEKSMKHASFDQFIKGLNGRPSWEIGLFHNYLTQKEDKGGFQ